MPIPYKTKDKNKVRLMMRKLRKTYPNIGARRVRQFMHIVNSEMERNGDKARAYAGAHATIQRNGELKQKTVENLRLDYLAQLIAEAIR